MFLASYLQANPAPSPPSMTPPPLTPGFTLMQKSGEQPRPSEAGRPLVHPASFARAPAACQTRYAVPSRSPALPVSPSTRSLGFSFPPSSRVRARPRRSVLRYCVLISKADGTSSCPADAVRSRPQAQTPARPSAGLAAASRAPGPAPSMPLSAHATAGAGLAGRRPRQ